MIKEILSKDIVIITKLVKEVLNLSGYSSIERLGGMTNHTYKIIGNNGIEYVFRIPGDGTEEIINRYFEKVSTELAYSVGVDTELIYFDNDGIKISKYIVDSQTMSPDMMRKEENLKLAAKLFQKIHLSGIDTGIPFKVFEIASKYEKYILDNRILLYDDYSDVKNEVLCLKKKMDEKYNIKIVPCHNDPLCENWIKNNKRMYLIDWEYAGMNDPMWDLADLSIEAGFDDVNDVVLLQQYTNKSTIPMELQERFIANKIFIDYLWTLWGKTRVPFEGIFMEEYALNRYERLKGNLKKIGSFE